MAYYIRVLGTADLDISIKELLSGLIDEGLSANFELDTNETEDRWSIIGVSNADGTDLMQIERNPVIEGELGKAEIEEFRLDIKEYRPLSAVKWLDVFFNKVKVIYAFQLLDASMEEENFPIVGSIKSAIWKKVGGILQADYEGFSNEEGYHILWQFSDDVTGEWNMAVKNMFGKWTNFTMDLGDQGQRAEFWAGNVPENARKH